MTNREKFIEVFGNNPQRHHITKSWWDEEYVSPQEPILDKIIAEIDIARFIDKDTKLCKNANASGLEVALQIIDKYRGESDCHECKTEYDCYECKKYAESEEKHDTDR